MPLSTVLHQGGSTKFDNDKTKTIRAVPLKGTACFFAFLLFFIKKIEIDIDFYTIIVYN